MSLSSVTTKLYLELLVLKPGQIDYIGPNNPDFSNAIPIKSGIPQVFLGGNKTGFLKVKKYGNGSMGDKTARWRKRPMFKMLHEEWVRRGGKKNSQ